MTSTQPHVTPEQSVADLEHVLTRCESSTRSETREALFRGLRLDLTRVRTTAQTEFDAAVKAPEVHEPYADLDAGLVALSSALERSLEAHRRARMLATETRTQLLLDTQLERLRAMLRQVERHVAPN